MPAAVGPTTATIGGGTASGMSVVWREVGSPDSRRISWASWTRSRARSSNAVDEHGDKIADGIDKAAAAADKKTGGKHHDKIAKATDKAKDGLDKLDGKNDDIATTAVTQPVPEESNEAYDLDEAPPGEHDSELPGAGDGAQADAAAQEENAETPLDQPSQ